MQRVVWETPPYTAIVSGRSVIVVSFQIFIRALHMIAQHSLLLQNLQSLSVKCYYGVAAILRSGDLYEVMGRERCPNDTRLMAITRGVRLFAALPKPSTRRSSVTFLRGRFACELQCLMMLTPRVRLFVRLCCW